MTTSRRSSVEELSVAHLQRPADMRFSSAGDHGRTPPRTFAAAVTQSGREDTERRSDLPFSSERPRQSAGGGRRTARWLRARAAGPVVTEETLPL
jgi:hypothetical protein